MKIVNSQFSSDLICSHRSVSSCLLQKGHQQHCKKSSHCFDDKSVMKMTWSVGRPFQGEIFSDSNQQESFGGRLGRVKSDQLQMLRTTRTEDRRLGASPPNMWKRIDGMKQKGSFHWKYINLWEKKMKKIFTWSVDPAILAWAPTGKWIQVWSAIKLASPLVGENVFNGLNKDCEKMCSKIDQRLRGNVFEERSKIAPTD